MRRNKKNVIGLVFSLTRVLLAPSNETEISHGRVSWQTGSDIQSDVTLASPPSGSEEYRRPVLPLLLGAQQFSDSTIRELLL